ncbi:hypothetical protein [Mastigocoleus testarum]|uniref:Uncharacterized protein n=1 Tax=Mastigocoleus testarum BC008 TaxID=371196 RepID=A0A0V7ZSU0_9CYAN|nr:hypothetical protein [Mastigocoleus testarum]KST67732.1 hypothetical protein BC008_44075 [Mastigocoleus testarum BC008]
MIISDLEISELMEVNHIVIGGSYAITNAQTFASSEFGYGSALGVAFGDQVFANTRTSTSIDKSKFSSNTFAFADAEAGGKSDSSSSFSSSTSISSNFTSKW